MQVDKEINEVVFIYSGKNLPRYVKPSLELASLTSGLNVRLIASKIHERSFKLPNLSFTSIEEFYNPIKFELAAKNIELPHDFRNGFWLKTLERFFILRQYMDYSNSKRIFHAELDQLLFNCDELLKNLNKLSFEGLFIPFHLHNKSVASIFYCSSTEYFDSLIDFACLKNKFENEMTLIASWAKKNTEKIRVLPTLSTEIGNKEYFEKFNFKVLSSAEVKGLVDAAQLGQWIGGEDPRNLPFNLHPTNHYVENNLIGTLTEEQLQSVQFYLGQDFKLKCVTKSNQDFNIYNLHLHSKIHNWIVGDISNLSTIIGYANEQRSIRLPTTRKIQVISILNTAFKSFLNDPFNVLSRRVKKLF